EHDLRVMHRHPSLQFYVEQIVRMRMEQLDDRQRKRRTNQPCFHNGRRGAHRTAPAIDEPLTGGGSSPAHATCGRTLATIMSASAAASPATQIHANVSPISA